jgi:ribonuclease BN (tRNA processing enzyme)
MRSSHWRASQLRHFLERRKLMQLTVLGCVAGMPRDGQPSSGYLVDTAAARILLDCGPGIATALSAVAGAGSLDAVIISHLHVDHCHDLLPLGKSLLSAIAHYPSAPDDGSGDAAEDAPQPPAQPPAPPPAQPAVELPLLPLYVPKGATPLLLTWASLVTVDSMPLLDRVFDGAYEVHEYEPGDTFTVGDAAIELIGLRHAKPNCGIRVTAQGATLAYTGDTGVTDDLTRLAANADLLLAEASLEHTDLGPHGHLSAADAARAAHAGGAAELVLTHMTSAEEAHVKAQVAEAARHFPGNVAAASPGARFTVGG